MESMKGMPWDAELEPQVVEGEEPEPEVEVQTEVQFVTGQAGTGKTYQFKQRLLEDDGLVLCATTGIAAMNLGDGVVTLNSLLKFFDYESLREKYIDGLVGVQLFRMASEEGVREIAVDEVSMLDGRISDILVESLDQANTRLVENRKPTIKLSYTGDFCQLAPVKAPWVFESEHWGRFAKNTTKLTKVWRQTDGDFLEALNAFRRGDGVGGVQAIKRTPVEFAPTVADDFEGTTIISKNDMVEAHNQRKLARLPGAEVRMGSFRWAADPKKLDNWNSVPRQLSVKDNALVMLLANDTQRWEYANGSLGYVRSYNPENKSFQVELLNGKVVTIRQMVRKMHSKEAPERFQKLKPEEWPKNTTEGKEKGTDTDFSYFDLDAKPGPKWCVGECVFYPMRLAWATTVHKSQGLTLDKVQINLEPGAKWAFIGSPAMLYVALSRAKTPGGVRIVGNPGLMSQRCKIDPKVREWL